MVLYKADMLVGVSMEFYSVQDLKNFLFKQKFLGSGSQGSCFVNFERDTVYKIFNAFLIDEEDPYYSYEDIMGFSFVKNGSFVWPVDIIKVDNMIVGYTMLYVNSTDLFRVNPLKINLNLFRKFIGKTYEDINLITSRDIKIYDLLYNIMLGEDGFKVVDTLEYSSGKTSFLLNRSYFDYAIMLFLVDGFFDSVVYDDKLLREMYLNKEVSSIYFIDEFKKKLSSLIDKDITKLEDAKKFVLHRNGEYIRDLKLV